MLPVDRDQDTLERFQEYFSLSEFFREDVVKKYGQFAWNFLDMRLIEILLILREKKGLPMVINYSNKRQRGFRDNKCNMVRKKKTLYLSGHVTGKAVDFNFKGEPARDTRKWIEDNERDLLNYPIRLEKLDGDGNETTWVHLDLYALGYKDMVNYFNA